jgi:beta-N-acetylhexosaminidase
MARQLRALVSLLVLMSSLLAPLQRTQARGVGQLPSPEERALALLESLTPEEKVGQLVLVTFEGPQVNEESPIYELITQYHIGGVVLSAANDNFMDAPDTAYKAWELIRMLQSTEWMTSQSEQVDPISGEPFSPEFIPLFVAISQEGDGHPYDQLLSGLTELPSPMAIGATWQPTLAEQIGEVLGRELAALGFNLLLGPSLDLLEVPKPESPGDMGVRMFGGDPYWVGEMGQAFIRGVHSGSQNQIAVVAKHFPGYGGSDRLPEEEVATVRKSLEQLKQIELAPFFAVTGNASDPSAMTDALLASHIRYQGFQGNIRATTRPISFDPQAFAQLMSLPAFATWRENGGVVVSDNLGSRAVRRFYDPSGQTFNARLIARDAFLVGNDLLYLGNFIEPGDEDTYTTIRRTLDFFAKKYREDPAFAQRVDESVLRLLELKFRLYSSFTLDNILPPKEEMEILGQGEDITFEVARQAATLISPAPEDLESAIPEPPDLGDRLVFISDTYTTRQCSECDERPVLAVDALQQAVLGLYGPQAGALVLPRNLESYSFEDLAEMLAAEPGSTALERAIRQADWLIFSMLDVRANRPASMALRQFLAGRPDLVRQSRIILFAFNAPYYLDATDISNLTAYFGLYSKTKPFVDVAARLLFKELLPAPGAPPVSISGVGYNLISATSPDPQQLIPLLLDLPVQPEAEATATPEEPSLPTFRLGDLLPVRTGIILDHNGHPVPDGTVVRFVLSVGGEGGPELANAEIVTSHGIARTTFRIETSGLLQVRAESDPAKMSEVLQVEVPQEAAATEASVPTLVITVTVEPSPPAAVPETPSIPTQPLVPLVKRRTDLGDWALSVLVALILGWLAYQVGARQGQVRWGLHSGLGALLGALSGYTYLALDAPGVQPLLEAGGRGAVILVVVAVALLGWGIAWSAHRIRRRVEEE